MYEESPLKKISATVKTERIKEWNTAFPILRRLERGLEIEEGILKEFYDGMSLEHTPKAALWDGQSEILKVSIKSTYSGSMRTGVTFDYMSKMGADGAINKVLHIVTPHGTTPSNLGTIIDWGKATGIEVIHTTW